MYLVLFLKSGATGNALELGYESGSAQAREGKRVAGLGCWPGAEKKRGGSGPRRRIEREERGE